MVSCSRLCSTLFTLTLLTTTLALAQSPSADPTTDVNPLIGTANGGNVFP